MTSSSTESITFKTRIGDTLLPKLLSVHDIIKRENNILKYKFYRQQKLLKEMSQLLDISCHFFSMPLSYKRKEIFENKLMITWPSGSGILFMKLAIEYY